MNFVPRWSISLEVATSSTWRAIMTKPLYKKALKIFPWESVLPLTQSWSCLNPTWVELCQDPQKKLNLDTFSWSIMYKCQHILQFTSSSKSPQEKVWLGGTLPKYLLHVHTLVTHLVLVHTHACTHTSHTIIIRFYVVDCLVSGENERHGQLIRPLHHLPVYSSESTSVGVSTDPNQILHYSMNPPGPSPYKLFLHLIHPSCWQTM